MNEPRSTQIRWLRSPDTAEAEALVAENNVACWAWYHSTYSICLIESSSVPRWTNRWRYRGRMHEGGVGAFMLFQPGETHATTRCSGPVDFSVLLIDPKFVQLVTDEADLGRTLVLRPPQVPADGMERPFRRLLESQGEPCSVLERQSRIVDFVAILLTQCAEDPVAFPARASPGLQRAREYIHAHRRTAIALDVLARVAGMSRFHFLRAFSAAFGLPPHQYQNHLRVESLRVMLKKGVSVQEADLGFADQSHLIRHFKRVVGVTPGEYVAGVARRGTRRPSSG